MPIIDPDGLFHGGRLGMCSDLARLHWPYLFCAANGFARIEIDPRRIRTTVYGSFREPPTEEQIVSIFGEFYQNRLAFVYQHGAQAWAQFETKAHYLKQYKSAKDETSPAPDDGARKRWMEAFESKSNVFSAIEDLVKFSKILPSGVGEGVGGVLGKQAASVGTGGVSPPLSKFPLTVQAVREFYDAPDLAFIHQLIQAVRSAGLEPDDAQIAAALRATHRKGQRGKALWLTTVPELLKNGGSQLYRTLLAEYHQ